MNKKCKEPQTCLVCGATERTSNHFGTKACMACASFFRRTVSFGIRFLCKATNNCRISQDIKFLCRSCRYESCIKAGMRRDLVQEKRDDSRVPKYVLESRRDGIKEVVRGYTTSSYSSSSTSTSEVASTTSASPGATTNSESPESTRSSSSTSSPTPSDEFSTILNISSDELLQYYIKQVQMAAMNRRFDLPKDTYEQFHILKRVNDKLALDICSNCPGTDLLEKEDLEILFRYCSFASLWMDSAWISATAKMDNDNPNNIHETNTRTTSNDNVSDPLTMFIDHFQDVIGSELSRIQLDVVEYSALKSFCIWKLGILDSTLTLKIVAQEQYFGVTQALSKYYMGAKGMEEFEMATRLADITLMLGSIFNIYQSMLQLYATLDVPFSIDTV